MRIPLVEDKKFWVKEIKRHFKPFPIEIVDFESGDDLLTAVQADSNDEFKVILIDWTLEGQRVSGPDLAVAIHGIKPYLKLFALTGEKNTEIVALNMIRSPFHRLISKDSLAKDSARIFKDLEDAAREVETIKMCEPFLERRDLRDVYLKERSSREWPDLEKSISETAAKLLADGTFTRERTLRDCLPTSKRKRPVMKNILIARRIIFAEILDQRGRLGRVEAAVGYAVPAEENAKEFTASDGAFKNYCSELGLKPDEFRNTGSGLLIEEARWLQNWCKANEVLYVFPLT